MQVATNVAGTMNGGARVERRSYSNINRNTRAKQNSRMLAVVILGVYFFYFGCFCPILRKIKKNRKTRLTRNTTISKQRSIH